MALNLKNTLKRILPGWLIRKITGIFYGWHGDYSDWNEARSVCTGYDSEAILRKVEHSAMLVKTGDVAFERDSFIFDEVQYSYPFLAALMWVAARNNGKINMLDFGGSLGSAYYQNRKFLDSLPDVNWSIVEQPGFVKTGKEHFEDQRLHFFYNVGECFKMFDINVALFSSVLQYLENPFEALDLLKSHGIKYLIIDRTPFITGKDRITVQKVNPRIYKASYPCRFFNKDKFLSKLSLDYDLVMEFDALDKANIKSEFKGFLFSLKQEPA
jgi:putative methyltransferase (TIGR04325 family)